MQIFLPFPDIQKSLDCLDKKRLGKQRVEAHQIINVIEFKQQRCKFSSNETYETIAWENHPAVLMVENYLPFLKYYYNESLRMFSKRGGSNISLVYYKEVMDSNFTFELPYWFGDENFHLSHRSNLLRKAKLDAIGVGAGGKDKKPTTELLERLNQFGINKDNTPNNLPYIWPERIL